MPRPNAVEAGVFPGAPEPHSPIVEERLAPRQAPAPAALTLGAIVVATTTGLAMAAGTAGPESVGEAAASGVFPVEGLRQAFGLTGARFAAVVVAGLGLAGVGVVLWRLLHRPGLALLATALVALDPMLWALGPAAIPGPFIFMTGTWALALMLWPRTWTPWLGSVFLGLAAGAEPAILLWAGPLAALLLLRGHVYAAPLHLLGALIQAVIIPGTVVALAVAGRGGWVDCLRAPGWDGVLLVQVIDAGGRLGLPNPLLWAAGLGVSVFLGIGTVLAMSARFRLQRLPGRVQLRLPGPANPSHMRILWIAALALLAPHPLLALPLLMGAVAAGIGELSRDAPGFGIALGAAAVILAAGFLVEAWDAATGTPGAAAQLRGLVPWAGSQACT